MLMFRLSALLEQNDVVYC